MNHQHEIQIQRWPAHDPGWAVCECGATIRIEKGSPVGAWHACRLCVGAPERHDRDPVDP